MIEKVFIEIESDKYDMEDLISRNVVLKILGERAVAHYEDWKAFKDYIGDRKEISKAKLKECSLISDIIAKLPVVEAVPVVHGEWIHVPSSDMATARAYECSNCKKMRYGSFLPPFCQMCGADMRKKV